MEKEDRMMMFGASVMGSVLGALLGTALAFFMVYKVSAYMVPESAMNKIAAEEALAGAKK